MKKRKWDKKTLKNITKMFRDCSRSKNNGLIIIEVRDRVRKIP